MNKRSITLLVTILGMLALPAIAQPVIGGGMCNSATLTGTYELLLNGRQLTSTGAVTQVFQGVGTAAFDGLSKVTINLTANTVTASQSFGTPVTYSGTYSLQSNCVGTIAITSGDTATYALKLILSRGRQSSPADLRWWGPIRRTRSMEPVRLNRRRVPPPSPPARMSSTLPVAGCPARL